MHFKACFFARREKREREESLKRGRGSSPLLRLMFDSERKEEGREEKKQKRKEKPHRQFSLFSSLSLSHLDPRAPLLLLAIFEGKRFFPSSVRSDASWRKSQQTNREKRGRTLFLSSSLFLSNVAKQPGPQYCPKIFPLSLDYYRTLNYLLKKMTIMSYRL